MVGAVKTTSTKSHRREPTKAVRDVGRVFDIFDENSIAQDSVYLGFWVLRTLACQRGLPVRLVKTVTHALKAPIH